MSLLAAQTRRKVLVLGKSNIKKDDEGFDDISEFWETEVTDLNHTSIESIEEFDYDTTGSITEDEYEMEISDATDEDVNEEESKGVYSEEKEGKESFKGSLSGSLPFEDTPNNTSSRSSAAGSRFSQSKDKKFLSPLQVPFGDDDSAGFAGVSDNEYMDKSSYVQEENEDLELSREQEEQVVGNKVNHQRRVSFGAGTKVESTLKVPVVRTPKGRPSNASTPSSMESVVTSSYSTISTPGSEEFPRGRRISDASFNPDDTMIEQSEDEDEEESGNFDDSEDAESSFIRSVEKKKLDRRMTGDDSEEESGDDEALGTRRSRRRTKGQRFQFWKGERPVYDHGEIIGFLTANPTPKKSKFKGGNKKGGRRAKNEEEGATDGEDYSVGKKSKSFNQKLLPSKYSYLARDEIEELSLWDDPRDRPTQLKITCFKESLEPPSALPITASRPPDKQIVGFAAQSFNVAEIPGVMSGWISGFVELPPGAIKDAEGVGECSQVFFVTESQDDALEVGIADPSDEEWNDHIAQRVVLRKGDSFYIPPGNIYRLENHSRGHTVMINWTIIKPLDQSNAP